MDLTTTYLGLKLKTPLIISSSKITKEFDSIKFCAEMGAGAIVTKSIFEEQLLVDTDLLKDQNALFHHYPEAIDLIQKHSTEFGMKKLLDLIADIKAKLNIPVIASINCVTDSEWTNYASKFEEAGADAIELNIAIIPFSRYTTCTEINNGYYHILESVKKNVSIPVSIKLESYFTNIIGMAHQLDDKGTDGLVLFNRFYRPDINIESEKIIKTNILSSPSESTKSLRWVALLSNKLNCDISSGTGIHTHTDVIKHLLAGAKTTQLCSTLFQNGISYIETILFEIERWMKRKGYDNISDFRGNIQKKYGDDISKFERIQFLSKDI